MRRSQGIFIAFTIALLCLGAVMASSVWALPPTAQDCSQTDSGERLKCKFDRMNSQIDDTLTEVERLDVVSPEQQTMLRNAHSRTQSEKNRVTAEGFRNLTKKKGKCYFKEKQGSGNGDGVCDPKTEQCEEVIGDQIGNEDGNCSPMKGGNKEVCVRVCDQEPGAADEEDFDPSAGNDIEQTLDDTAEVLYAASTKVKSAALRAGAVRAVSSDPASKCTNVLVGTRTLSDVELWGIREGANAVKLAADACDSGCNQDSLGFNCSAVCIPFRLAENIMGAIADGFEMNDGAVTDNRIDAMAECMQELGQKLNGIETKLNEVIQLLNTPQGRRPEFPVK